MAKGGSNNETGLHTAVTCTCVPVSSWYLPSSQGVQAAAPFSAANVPLTHLAHRCVGSVVAVPGPHFCGFLLLGGQYSPALHFTHSFCFRCDW